MAKNGRAFTVLMLKPGLVMPVIMASVSAMLSTYFVSLSTETIDARH
jgi:hypothetical protein